MKYIYGILLSIIIGIIALSISNFLPIGSVALAIIVGAIIGNTIKLDEKYNSGITYSEKTLLAIAIALMGINLDFVILSELGIKSILMIITAMIITIAVSIYFAKLFKFDKDFTLILGIGNGVCGSAAIAATKDIVGLDKQKAGLAVAIVNFLGTIGIFLLPFIAYLFTFSDVEAGLLIGNTLQAVGQVVASGFSVNDSVGQSATIVKMGRILMLTLVIVWLIYFVSKKASFENGNKIKLQIPNFVIGFVFFSIITTIGILPNFVIDTISSLSHYLLLVAMAAIGLKINFKTIKEHGSRAFLIATYIFIVQIIFSSLFIILFF
jgi:uncharacterized integral membrane protein (TIGR00698 family)